MHHGPDTHAALGGVNTGKDVWLSSTSPSTAAAELVAASEEIAVITSTVSFAAVVITQTKKLDRHA